VDAEQQPVAGRQPIFDRKLNVVGYELRFGEVLGLRSLAELGLKRLVGDRGAWIKLSPELLTKGLAQVLPKRTIVEVASDELASRAGRDALSDVRAAGAHLALRHSESPADLDALLELVDIVKLDLAELGRERFLEELARARCHGATVVAEGVEDHSDHSFCWQAGCDMFQGRFFTRPDLTRRPRVDASRLAVLEFLAILHDADVEFADLERTIVMDVGMSVRLLRYLNSAFFGLDHRVRSVGQALRLLGVQRLKHWAALTLFASIDDKPTELMITALVRARLCELIAERDGYAQPGEPFTVGLLSVLDALVDVPMSQALADIPLAVDLSDALISHAGPMGRLLECVLALEAAEFAQADQLVPGAPALYPAALAWADEAAAPLFGP
jgi:c-di-GMP phosphodiesterase